MKTLVLSMISIAATVAAMTACTSESDGIDDLTKDAPVEIKASAGVGSITTKGVMDTWGASGSNAFFCKAEDNKDAAVWASATPIYAKITESGNISFYDNPDRTTEVKQYYNADENLKSWLCGCYLGDAVISNSATTLTNNKVTFTITGQEDIMATNELSGTKKTHLEKFTFNHLLSNLSFMIVPKAGSELSAVQGAFGKVTKIEVLKQPNLLDLTLEKTPSLKPNGTPGSETFSLSNEVAINNDATFGDIMIYPNENAGKTGSEIEIIIYTENAKAGINVKIQLGDGNTGLVINTKYTVTLSFSATDIEATAQIGNWSTGTGSGQVE